MDLTNGKAVHAPLWSARMEEEDHYGENHMASSLETPLRSDAFDMSGEEKEKVIAYHFNEIMQTLGLDMNDDSLSGTPKRVAKMFVREIFEGLDPKNKPKATLFENKFQYKQMLLERDIRLESTCEHHFLPIFGVAHIAYIPKGKVIGLSKLNRIVDYYGRRPQVQERLTKQIGDELRRVLETDDVAVYIDAVHMCVQTRGVGHKGCSTVTTDFSGKFLNDSYRSDFMQSLQTKM